MFKEFNLEGKVALVTGGGRGIGKAIALVLAEAGADVAVVARTSSQIEESASAIETLGRRSLALECDVTDFNQVKHVVNEATEAMGGIDILVNNAGASAGGGAVAPLPELEDYNKLYSYSPSKVLTPEAWERGLATNLTHLFSFCQALGPQMLGRRSGKVVNILSNNAKIASPFTGSYNAGKAGALMFTKVLALEWAAYSVNVNAIAPGFFPTEMTRRRYENPDRREAMLSAIPLRRFAPLRDVGLLTLYLASPASDWMTGQVLYLDGGESAFCG